jgi:hypothetical protein
MQADYSYILTTAGWGLPMATGTNPNRVQKGNRGTKQNPLSSSSDFVLCELNTFEEPLSKEWMGTTAMMTFTLRLSTNPMKKTRAPSSAPGLLVRTRVYIYQRLCWIFITMPPLRHRQSENMAKLSVRANSQQWPPPNYSG